MIKITIEVDRKEELDAIVDSYSTASDKRDLEGKILSDQWEIRSLKEEIKKLSNTNNFKNRKKRR